MERDDRQPTTYELEQLLNENFQQKEKIRNQENEIVRMIQELTQLQNEQFELKANIEHKGRKIGQLTYEMEQLKDKNSQLEQKIQHKENEIAHLKRDNKRLNFKISEMVRVTRELATKNDKLVEEKKLLLRRIEQLKCKECNMNCVIHAMLWICQNKVVGVDVELCRRQLEKIIIAYAGDKIEKEDLKCEQLMEILRKCEIVTIAAKYKYPSEMDAKVRVIDEAWDRLMITDGNERVLVLGRVISTANDEGHVEVCDLETRGDGKVIIQNPQKDYCGHGNQQDFRNYVMKDEGLILFSVDLEKLRQIMEEHENILHLTIQSEQTLTIPPGATDEVQ